MKKYLLILLLFCSQYALPSEGRHELKKKIISKSNVVFFGVKIGGPISCGAHQGMIKIFNDRNNLSCENSQIHDSLENFNRENSKEIFLIIFSLTPTFKNGEVIEAYNNSDNGLEYGKNYLLFLSKKNGSFFFEKCTFMEEDMFQPLLMRSPLLPNRNEVEEFMVLKNHRCKYL